jgi:hypothetical protein
VSETEPSVVHPALLLLGLSQQASAQAQPGSAAAEPAPSAAHPAFLLLGLHQQPGPTTDGVAP